MEPKKQRPREGKEAKAQTGQTSTLEEGGKGPTVKGERATVRGEHGQENKGGVESW